MRFKPARTLKPVGPKAAMSGAAGKGAGEECPDGRGTECSVASLTSRQPCVHAPPRAHAASSAAAALRYDARAPTGSSWYAGGRQAPAHTPRLRSLCTQPSGRVPPRANAASPAARCARSDGQQLVRRWQASTQAFCTSWKKSEESIQGGGSVVGGGRSACGGPEWPGAAQSRLDMGSAAGLCHEALRRNDSARLSAVMVDLRRVCSRLQRRRSDTNAAAALSERQQRVACLALWLRCGPGTAAAACAATAVATARGPAGQQSPRLAHPASACR